MDESSSHPIGTILEARAPKEIRPKASKPGTVSDRNRCPVYNLTKEGQNDLPDNHKLFLTALQDHSGTQWESVAAGTIVHWLNIIMSISEIGTTKYNVHSIKAGASTKAVALGISLEAVKEHTN